MPHSIYHIVYSVHAQTQASSLPRPNPSPKHKEPSRQSQTPRSRVPKGSAGPEGFTVCLLVFVLFVFYWPLVFMSIVTLSKHERDKARA